MNLHIKSNMKSMIPGSILKRLRKRRQLGSSNSRPYKGHAANTSQGKIIRGEEKRGEFGINRFYYRQGGETATLFQQNLTLMKIMPSKNIFCRDGCLKNHLSPKLTISQALEAALRNTLRSI